MKQKPPRFTGAKCLNQPISKVMRDNLSMWFLMEWYLLNGKLATPLFNFYIKKYMCPSGNGKHCMDNIYIILKKLNLIKNYTKTAYMIFKSK